MKNVFSPHSAVTPKPNTPNPAHMAEKLLREKPEQFWNKSGEKIALNIFKSASKRVPAYKNFLKKNKVNPDKIKTITDLSSIPHTDKQNYIQSYELKDRCWDGKLDNIKLIASSSGTKGVPSYWPRSQEQENEAVLTHELLFRNLFAIEKHSTLVIIGFPMGVYVSGIATTLPVWQLINKYNASVICPGNNKQEFLKAVKNLGQNFKQLILVGHPFFLKDVIETGKLEGIKWKNYHLNLMFCSEGFSEEWREYIIQEAGGKNCRAFNTYGSSEMLLMAYETPDSVGLKKKIESLGFEKKLLNSTELFNFFQYNPALRYIEEENSELLFTSNSGIPLVRFNLHDKGRIVKQQQILDFFPAHKPNWNLPYIALFGRSDYAIVFYAANIYPQHIHKALSKKIFLKEITGKFSMTKGYLKNLDEFLEINIELRAHSTASGALIKKIQQEVVRELKYLNSEYKFLTENLQKDLTPKIKLWPYSHEKYFKPGLKPKYIQ
ncbi:MAG: phenylacetate--CoA ligase family protein [Candidatus Doudnabacteria bacterium]|nr:phenylacetate--CoA ligase family protein [Candidatus Doudnabacteria bacterium]